MPVDFLRKTLNTELFAVEVHFLAILCKNSDVSGGPSGESGLRGETASATDDVLNLTLRELGSFEVRGRRVVFIWIVCRAFGGRRERNSRADRAVGEKGLNLVEISVMNLVIILAVQLAVERLEFGFGPSCEGPPRDILDAREQGVKRLNLFVGLNQSVV